MFVRPGPPWSRIESVDEARDWRFERFLCCRRGSLEHARVTGMEDALPDCIEFRQGLGGRSGEIVAHVGNELRPIGRQARVRDLDERQIEIFQRIGRDRLRAGRKCRVGRGE